MLNLDNFVSNKNENKDNNWPSRMLIIGPSGSGKTNTLLHLINNLHPIDKIYLYAKDLSEPKYEFLINKREQAGIKNLNDPHAFIKYSNDMDDVLDHINNYNKNRDKKVLIVFDDMIADIMSSKNFKAIIKELFISKFFTSKFMEKNLPKAEFDALKSLIRNKELIIQKADKGNTVVLLNRKDYISKMKLILADTSKFKKIQIDDSKVLNHLIHMENKIVELLKRLKEKQEISDKVYKEL